MIVEEQTAKRCDGLDLPWNLCEWVDQDDLVRWIFQDIDSLDWANPELQRHMQKHPAYRPKMLLRLMTYAYAAGMFESEEVVNACRSDPVLKSISENAPPARRAMIRFRRENRGLFKWSLVQVLQRAVRAQSDLGDRPFPAGLKRYLVLNATERLDLAKHMDRGATDE